MARKRRPKDEPKPTPPKSEAKEAPRPFWNTPRLAMAVGVILAVHWALAVQSLTRENPTVDEVVHLPAGVSYWQKGTFRLYAHNPPLIKLVAALPVVLAGPNMAKIYAGSEWATNNKAGVAHEFAYENAFQYFELFTRARVVMPAFSVLGGWLVFVWSRRLYGDWGGGLSLMLWAFCPNVLAHARLITTDVGATVLGFGATFLFWRYLHKPTWGRAALAGLALGVAELAKFSMLLLYGLWPLMWLVHSALVVKSARGIPRAIAQGVLIVAISVLTIDAGYGFEGVGRPLGGKDFEFVSASLTRPEERGGEVGFGADRLLRLARTHRVNRFRGTALERLPAPLPKWYLLGFDEQKIESEGIPKIWGWRSGSGPRPGPDEITGYSVYLNGELRDSGWWYYYLAALAHKVPEGTWWIVSLSFVILLIQERSRAAWADEVILLMVPATVLGVMSFATDINLGLRYVLPIFPYMAVFAGKVAPWALEGEAPETAEQKWGQAPRRLGASPHFVRPSRIKVGVVAACLGMTVASTLSIHPHYLAYFNTISGGPSRRPPRLIDSNLDWGQDLVELREWVREHAPKEPIGLAYFGQINPAIFALRGDDFEWFLPPPLPDTMRRLPRSAGIDKPPRPGLYAVSVSLEQGLKWAVYDRTSWAPFAAERGAYRYFQKLEPIDRVGIGHSILIYRITDEDARWLAALFWRPAVADSVPRPAKVADAN
ncbi:MAG TPA: glycosyltransferase family 39 protein [Isosphaeraceae bacterium]|nr:glycosyltransferase family 39 protein [Isosphaeraceae bacterium]